MTVSHVETFVRRQWQSSPQEIVRQSGSNFLKAFFFLSPARRRAIEAIYAFARVLDDAVDEWTEPHAQTVALSFWERELISFGTTGSGSPLMRELAWAVDMFKIPMAPFHDLLRGCRRDITTHRYATFAELEAYCYDVASTVGLMTLPVFGIEDEAAIGPSIALGKALQLTNILRDVYEDSLRDRVYLPLEDCERFGYFPDELREKRYNGNFLELMRFQSARAEAFFIQADRFLKNYSSPTYLSPFVMSKTYYMILQNLKRSQFKVFSKKIGLSRLQKLTLLLEVKFRDMRLLGQRGSL